MRQTAATLLVVCLTACPVLASPAQAVAAALTDARTLAPDAAARTRYLDLSHLPADYLDEAARVLDFQANSLSREPDLVRLRRVRPDLLAVVLDDYRLDPKTWEKFAKIDPYFHVQIVATKQVWWDAGVYQGQGYAAGWYATKVKTSAAAPWLDAKQIAELIARTQSQSPVVRGDWFLAQTCRQTDLNNRDNAVGYYSQLGIKDRKTFEALSQFDEKKSIKVGYDQRAALERSGVSYHNRQVEIFRSLTGGYYRTLDTDASVDDPNDKKTGNKNAIRHLRRGEFSHLAEEHYQMLPNKLWAFLLCDAEGKLQNTAPDFISGNDAPLWRGRDMRIINGVGCLACHVEAGLKPLDDWVRRTLRPPLGLQSPDYKVFVELRRQYFSSLDEQMDLDRLTYTRAVAGLTGWKPREAAKAYTDLYFLYVERPWAIADIAEAVGCTEERMRAALQATAKTGFLDTVLSGLLQNPQSRLRTEHAEEVLPIAAEIVRLAK